VRWLPGELVVLTYLVGHRRSKPQQQSVIVPLFTSYFTAGLSTVCM
jgi:hypothetical protein